MYPIDLHTHTIASTHAYSTIHDYIPIAKKKGIKLFAMTDHGPKMGDAPHEWHFINLQIMPRFIDGVGILRGVEANIMNEQGELDCTTKMLGVVDLVIASFHEYTFLPKDCATNTQAMINTIKGGVAHIIGHPGNPRYPIDIKAVAEAAAKYNVAMEINNSSFIHSRKGSEDNCFKVAQAVKEAGGLLAFGSDSHIALSLGDFEHCIRITQAIDFPQECILNSQPRRLLDFLEQRGGRKITEFDQF